MVPIVLLSSSRPGKPDLQRRSLFTRSLRLGEAMDAAVLKIISEVEEDNGQG
jgi:hypothetical protein